MITALPNPAVAETERGELSASAETDAVAIGLFAVLVKEPRAWFHPEFPDPQFSENSTK